MIDAKCVLFASLLLFGGNILLVQNADNCPPATGNTPPAITMFNNQVLQLYGQSQRLRKVFDFEGKISTQEHLSAVFYSAAATLIDFMKFDTIPLVSTATNGNVSKCVELTPDFLKAIGTGSTSKYLYQEKFLNCSNAINLAKSYVQSREQAADKYFDEKCPRSKLAALVNGFLEFLFKTKFLSPQNQKQFSDLVRSWTEEYKLQASLQKGNKCVVPPTKPPSLHASDPILKPDDKKCQEKSNTVTQFVTSFQNEIKRSSLLTEAFNLIPVVFSKEELSRAAFYLPLYHLQKLGASKPALLADFMSRFVQDIKSFQADSVPKHYSTFMAKYLVDQKYLNDANAQQLAAKYAKVTENKAKTIMNIKEPRSKIIVWSFGIRDFLTENKFFTPPQGPKLAFYYGNEYHCMAINPSK